MKLNKLFLVSILLLAILALGAVNASEDKLTESQDSLQEEINAPTETDILLEDNELSLTDFKNELESDKTEINLTNDYKYDSDKESNQTQISTNRSFVLDGQGHTIDGAGSDILLKIDGDDVIIKNTVFKNFNRTSFDKYDPFFSWRGDRCRLENCSFENISSLWDGKIIDIGGEFEEYSGFTISNCIFKDNKVVDYICFTNGNIQISNCSFENNTVSHLITGEDGATDNIQINNCSFFDNDVFQNLIRIEGNNCQINNCNFTNNSGSLRHISEVLGNNTRIFNCSYENNNISDYFGTPSILYLSGDTVGEKLSGENISVNKVSFINNDGLPIRWNALSGNVTDCVFIGNNGSIEVVNGSVYRDNGLYDFEMNVSNDTVIGELIDENILVDLLYYGSSEGDIVILLDGREVYNKKLNSDKLSINVNELSNPKTGEIPMIVKFIHDRELILYNGTVIIDYPLSLNNNLFFLILTPHEKVYLNFTLPKDATGTLVFNDGISNHTLEYADGKANYTIDGSNYNYAGTYDMSLSLIGDPKYFDKTVDDNFGIYLGAQLPKCVAVGETDYIYYDVFEDFDGNLSIYMSNEHIEKLDLIFTAPVKGKGMIQMPAFEVGEYTLLIEFTGDEDTLRPEELVCLENPQGFNSSIEATEILLGDDVVITLSSPWDTTRLFVFIDSNDPFYTQRTIGFNGSEYIHRISNLTSGEHKIKIIVVNQYINPVYSNNFIVTVTRTSADLQELIDNASSGDVIDLGNKTFYNVSDVNITKNLTITGGTIIGSESGGPIFNVAPISEGPSELNITDVNFKLNNVNTVVKAIADNASDNMAIDVAAINIKDNNIELANDEVVPESLLVLELLSDRPILSTTNDIAISGNTIAAGIRPFLFEVSSIESGSDVNISNQNISFERKATQIIYEDMNTTAVSPLDPNTGEWFTWRLVDQDGKPIANVPMKIGFNGVIYDEDNGMITDKDGYAKLQINLGYKGDYTFAVSFLGNDEYNASFVVAKIKVATQTGSLTVPNRSYAASAKTKALTATLKTKSGKVIANKKVGFTVNGKTYSVKTNAKGVATVNVSLNKKGTYNFVAKFAGDSTYAAITKKATLVIK